MITSIYQNKFEIMVYGKLSNILILKTLIAFERLIGYIGHLLIMIYKWIECMHDEYYHSSSSFDESSKWSPFAQILLNVYSMVNVYYYSSGQVQHKKCK
jgi:hypothetical protein